MRDVALDGIGNMEGIVPKELDCERCNQLEDVIYEVSMLLAGEDGRPTEEHRKMLNILGRVMDAEACKRHGV